MPNNLTPGAGAPISPWPGEIVCDPFEPKKRVPVTPEMKARSERKRRRDKAWRENNPERAREGTRKWKKRNKEAVSEHEARRKTNDYHRPFVAIDAEGMNFPGDDILVPHGATDELGNPIEPLHTVYPKHRTILLGAKGWKRKYSATALADDPALSRIEGEETAVYWLGSPEKKPLASLEILEWLVNLSEKFNPANGYPDGVNFVSFSFSYDTTQILADLPRDKVWEITRGKKFGTNKEIRGPVFYRNYAIKYLKGKYVEIWRLKDENQPYITVENKGGSEKRVLNSDAHIRINDVFGFYQESFVNATSNLARLGYIKTEEHETVKINKGKRFDFANVDFDTIKHYCSLELDHLAKACTVLRDGFDKTGIRLKDWTGAGAAAGALIRKMELKDKHYSPDIASKDLTPQQVRAHHAFYGGRIELLKQGYAEGQTLWVYDIASAYPTACTHLPSMKGGRWENGGRLLVCDFESISFNINMLSLFRVQWAFDEVAVCGLPVPFFPFPYRVRKKGLILYPSKGHAWLMRDEVLAGVQWFKTFFPRKPIDQYMRVEEFSRFHPADESVRPYAFVNDLFAERRKLKQGGDIAEKNIKLTINSLYGKTAQNVGQPGKPPSCACPYYAAAITAWCRSQLLKAALIDPYAIVSFMTDGIVSTRPLDLGARLKPEGSKDVQLGDWEVKTVKNGFFLMSGIYAYEENDGKNKGKNKGKSRGFNPEKFILRKELMQFFLEDVLPAWHKPAVPNPDKKKGAPKYIHPPFSYEIRRYVTAGAACASEAQFKLIGRWADVRRSLDISEPGPKRDFRTLDPWAYFSPYLGDKKIKPPKLAQLKMEEKWYDIPAKDLLACIKAGEPLRCRFLIPTTPVVNPTPRVLSAPSVPAWVEEGECGETAIENSIPAPAILREILDIVRNREMRTKDSYLKLCKRVKYFQRDARLKDILKPFDGSFQGGYSEGVWIYLEKHVKAALTWFVEESEASERDGNTLSLFDMDSDTVDALCGL